MVPLYDAGLVTIKRDHAGPEKNLRCFLESLNNTFDRVVTHWEKTLEAFLCCDIAFFNLAFF
jgi:hypothetical protein